MINEDKTRLTQSDFELVAKAHAAAEEELLGREIPRANVVGYGSGVKWKNGQPTGEPALIALVTHKLPPDALGAADLVPPRLESVQTDVLEVGYVYAGVDAPLLAARAPARARPALMDSMDGAAVDYRMAPVEEVGVLTLTKRVRPAKGGFSVGHFKITAGTIATCVYDILAGGTGTPPLPGGVGKPPKYYILSNNHVLANSNAAAPGDPILQPGPFDGGTLPGDRIGSLSRFVPIQFEPPLPRAFHRNLVDAAVAEAQFSDVDREVFWEGRVSAWRQKSNVTVGMRVQKVGRTSNLSLGRITALNATIDVNYGGGRVARFRDQIVTSNISDPGDSGSLVVSSQDHAAVGLLFAGSSVATIVNQIQNVRALLGIEVAELEI
jgi:hypothetical protein